MSESVPVRCPACRRERLYAVPAWPCACGAAVTPLLDGAAPPAVVLHRAWAEEWITLRCPRCARPAQWPHPELGCPCGTVLRLPVTGTASVDTGGGDPGAAPATAPDSPRARRPAHPLIIRTARDAVTATVLYLRALGFRDIRRADQRPTAGIGLAAPGLLAQVDPSVRPATLRDVECLWLTAMTESARCVYFSLAGYADDTRAAADRLGVPLFALDLTGIPRPVNPAADALDTDGA
ncbi:hypothetical protein OG739_28755 [Streptomyces longwoodensis]|uniref:hypothetical protein n=1 Tax=Streptomyces longwoodensis TaxID=68231 RepID=UPI00225AEB94|nr:hypothetical protein [Streptomyces longwoodensis]MCX4996692.1 hypothetical protein [Streptomyces longwoodensis]WTI44331.1 hypothetical protein OG547_07345 [Streptomyces longwoodensis]WUC70628.1 hypothetical protein OG416_07365 [Streptomyces longwoodensis]